MGRRGPPPKPSELKKAAGTYRKDRAARNEFRPTPGAPDPPPHLDTAARAEWDRVTPELAAAGVLSRIDGAVLEAYCTAYSLATTYAAAVSKHPIVWIVSEGWGDDEAPRNKRGAADEAAAEAAAASYARPNPLLGAATRQWTLVRQLAAEFGLSPSARSRVSVPAAEKPSEQLAPFIFETAPSKPRKKNT